MGKGMGGGWGGEEEKDTNELFARTLLGHKLSKLPSMYRRFYLGQTVQ